MISVEKIKKMRMNSKKQDRVTIDGQDIEDVEEFTSLGATICKKKVA